MANSLYDDEVFDSSLETLFSQEEFYANPMRTKIFVNFTDNKDEEEIVGNAVVANLEEVNEKIPVYSYNSSTYQKYLQGKRIVTGIIALRKITVASFLSLLKRKAYDDKTKKKYENLKKQIEELEKISSQDNLRPIGLINALKSELHLIDTKKDNNINVDEFYSNEAAKILEKDNLLYYIENAQNDEQIGGNKAKIRFEFKSSYEEGPTIKIKDILFIKKQTEINIDKTDIFEVYSFIGNPDFEKE